MTRTEVSAHEALRLEALRQCEILDTAPEQHFDDLAKLAARLCQAPVAIVNLVDRDRMWFKAAVGLQIRQVPREGSICGHAILQDEPLVIPDATKDERTRSIPLVVGPPHVRFYAGAQLRTHDGFVLGTLCVLDTKPRQMTSEQFDALEKLTRQAVALLELRRANAALSARSRQLAESQEIARLASWRLSIAGGAGPALRECDSALGAATGRVEPVAAGV